MKVLPEGIDLQVVPNIDDVLQCPELAQDFGSYVDTDVTQAFGKWKAAYGEYFLTPVHQRKPVMLKLVEAFQETANSYPELKPMAECISKEAHKRDKVPDSAIMYCTSVGIRVSAKRYLLNWLVDHNMKWKTTPWVPAQNILFSDLSMAYGMGTVERMIEEKALKGKSGFSKFLAKRQVKKNSVANVRTAPAMELNGPSKTVFATGNAMEMMSFGKDFGNSAGAADFSTAIADLYTPTVPTLAETLAAPYLRKFFENSTLGTVLSSTEITLWEALNAFYTKYCTMESEDLIGAQDEMRAEIGRICEKYRTLLEVKRVESIQNREKKAKVIFPQFFRQYEMELYASAHETFEKHLKEKGWK